MAQIKKNLLTRSHEGVNQIDLDFEICTLVDLQTDLLCLKYDYAKTSLADFYPLTSNRH